MANIHTEAQVFVSALSLGASSARRKKNLVEVLALIYGLNIVCVERSGVRRSALSW